MPPLALTDIVPLEVLQVVPVMLRVDDSGFGCVIINDDVAVHPFASETTTWYEAGDKLLNELTPRKVFPLSMLY